MYFKSLEIHGFKSFAEPIQIEFNKGITCVVGPNGSGKSNICDAIRWVLGAKSAKSLRGEKMEDVIFSGTTSRKSRGMAEVTLVIDNSTGLLPLDYSEVAITRRLYKSGESEYLINNNQCRMKDIISLTMDTGIGVEGYSIVGQGKISDIISNNTESIREILEEKAGIVTYRSKKSEAERKLASANSNMERVNDIISELEGRIGGLKEESEKATEYLSLKERYKTLEINITLKNIENIQLKNEYIKDDLMELSYELESINENNEELETTLSKGSEERGKLDKLIQESTSKQMIAVEEINRLVNQGELCSERLSTISLNQERLINEIAELTSKVNKEKENLAQLLNNEKELEDKEIEAKKHADKKIESSTKFMEELSKGSLKIDEKKNQLFNLQSQVNGDKKEIESIENLQQSLEERKQNLLEQKQQSEENSNVSSGKMSALKEETKRLSKETREVKEQEVELKNQYSTKLSEEGLLSRELQENRIKISQMIERKNTFEEMESNYDGFNSAVKYILKSDIKGLHGTVADIIKVPSGFETAIETALGGTIQNIVCQEEDAAKIAVERLKRNKIGRLTFLPLNSIRGREVRKETVVATFPGVKGYGVDCLKYDEKYSNVIRYLLGNVIVIDNMENAISLSRKLQRGFKLVTLDGEVINASGAITGGQYKHKSANILGRKTEILALEEQISSGLSKEESKKAKLKELRNQLEEILKEIKEKEIQIQLNEREFGIKESQIISLDATIVGLEESKEKWQEELNKIQTEKDMSRETITRLQASAAKNQEESTKIENSLEEDITSNEEVRIEADKGREEITQAQIQVSNIKGEKDKVRAISQRIEETLDSHISEKVAKEETLNGQKEEREELLSRSTESDELIKEKKDSKEAIDAYLEELYEEKTKLIKDMEEASREKSGIDEKKQALQNQKYELEIKKVKQETQLENAKEKLWEEFEVSYLQAMDFKNKDFVMSSGVKENREIKNKIKELGDVNIGSIKEYESVSERLEFLTGQREDILDSVKSLKGIIVDMDKVIKNKFKESFDQVLENFEQVFKELYGGGSAKITLADESDPFESEIEIIAQPPGKQLKNINLLSGGEKTMTAIALMFAVLKTKPTPCCILDEVEAALDDSNLEIFGNYLRNFGGVQFTLITHQKTTMEHADVMYGVTMPESGISKVYSLEMNSPLPV